MSAVPMSEDAIREFEHLLGENAVPNGGMTLEWVDGYFSALIVGPATVSPARQLSRIWGVAMAEADEAGATAMLEATVAFWNHIVWRVAQPLADEDAEPDSADMEVMPLLQTPAFDEEADELPDSVRDFPVGALWADGFLAGVGQAGEGWDRWCAIDESLRESLDEVARLTLFDGAYAADPARVDAPDSPDFEERWEILAGVPGLLQYCNEMRQEGVFPQAPRRREAVPGRNDPCPCGSGRKYKKCCGAGVTLH